MAPGCFIASHTVCVAHCCTHPSQCCFWKYLMNLLCLNTELTFNGKCLSWHALRYTSAVPVCQLCLNWTYAMIKEMELEKNMKFIILVYMIIWPLYDVKFTVNSDRRRKKPPGGTNLFPLLLCYYLSVCCMSYTDCAETYWLLSFATCNTGNLI